MIRKFSRFLFAHGLTRLSDLPCMDPKTRPHIQEPDALVTCRLNFSYYYFPFRECALWNEVPNRHFLLYNWLTSVWLFLKICKFALPEFFGPPPPKWFNESFTSRSREARSFTCTWTYFHRIFYRPLPQSLQVYPQNFYVAIIHDFPTYYEVVCNKSNSWISVPPNII